MRVTRSQHDEVFYCGQFLKWYHSKSDAQQDIQGGDFNERIQSIIKSYYNTSHISIAISVVVQQQHVSSYIDLLQYVCSFHQHGRSMVKDVHSNCVVKTDCVNVAVDFEMIDLSRS